MLFSWGGRERGEAHHLGRVPERLLQVASLDVPLEVGQPQHRQVHGVCGDARQAGPLLLGAHGPVVARVGVVFVVLEVVACGVGFWDRVGLQKEETRTVHVSVVVSFTTGIRSSSVWRITWNSAIGVSVLDSVLASFTAL